MLVRIMLAAAKLMVPSAFTVPHTAYDQSLMDTSPSSSWSLHSPRLSASIAEEYGEHGDGAQANASARLSGMSPSASSECTAPALVHDWLPVYGGAERVLEQMIHALPASSIYSLIDHLPAEQRGFLQGKPVNTSFIQKLPFSKRMYRYYLPMAPLAIEQFDLRSHDVVVSSSYAVAKGILTRADQLHISYVHSPMRYAWDLYHDYLEQSGLTSGIRSAMARLLMHYMRCTIAPVPLV